MKHDNVIIITAAYGVCEPWDLPNQGCHTLLVSDRDLSITGWETKVDPLSHLHPRMAALIPKVRPELYTDKEIVIWIDAQFRIKSNDFADWCVTNLEEESDIALLKHVRSGLKEEAQAGQGPAGRGRFDGQRTIDQVEYYKKCGHPDTWGLWSTGLSVRRMTDNMKRAGYDWAAEIASWSTHCQLSAPYVFRKNNVVVNNLPPMDWNNKIFGKTHKVKI